MVELDGRLSREGRVVVPAPIRRLLGVQPGDRVRFVVTGDRVELTNPRALAHTLWAKNPSGGPENLVSLSAADHAALADRWDRLQASQEDDDRTDEEVAAEALAALGLEG